MASSRSDFEVWNPPKLPLIQTIDDIDPQVLGALRGYFESVDPIRVEASQLIGIRGFMALHDSDTSTLDITSTGYTSAYSYDVPANTLQTEGALCTVLKGKYLNDTGSAKTFSMQIKYGSTIMFEDASDTVNPSAGYRGWGLVLYLAADGQTNAQKLSAFFTISSDAVPAHGYGELGGVAGSFEIGGSAAENSRTKLTLDVLFKNSASNPTTQIVTKLLAYTYRVAF